MRSHEAAVIPLARLRPAEWNANRVPARTLAKIRRSIEEFGVVENLVARPHPDEDGAYEVISGNHRLGVLAELGFDAAPVVVVVDVDDAHARVLAQTLNRTRGKDDPAAYARLLDDVLRSLTPAQVISLLPETETGIDRALRSMREEPGQAAPRPPEQAESKPGEVYRLGPHRLVCGDATDPDAVAEAVGGAAEMVFTDPPPYNVGYDAEDRARHVPFTSPASHYSGARLASPLGAIAGDELPAADYDELLVRSFANAAANLLAGGAVYVCHAETHGLAVRAAFLGAGFRLAACLIWRKTQTLTQSDYQWAHEPILYGWLPGAPHRWFGDRKETTVWELPQDHYARGGDRKYRHPTQKPVALVARAIRNSSEPDDVVLDPFAGSGATLAACEKTGRVAALVELDPRWCDVIRARHEQSARAAAG